MLIKIYSEGKQYQVQGNIKKFSDFLQLKFNQLDSIPNFDEIIKLWNEKTPRKTEIKSVLKSETARYSQSELSKKRFEICKSCDKSSENGHKCSLHKGCCFGRWRAMPENRCFDNPPKWDAEK